MRKPVGRPGLESLLFIVGNPLSHSLSPAMHNGVIARKGMRLRYVPLQIDPAVLPDLLRVVRDGNFLGGNVTIPFKEAAAALADTRSEEVAFCGAANVLRVREGRLVAENTDGRGFLDAVRDAGWGRTFRRAVILGAGGSARGISHALCRSGTRKLVLLNRSPERAGEIAASLSSRFPRASVTFGPLHRSEMMKEFRGADLVVQCTSLGLLGEWKDFPFEGVEKSTRIADIVYRKGGTRLVEQLRKRGVSAIDGLPMLAHQAARSFALWTGVRVPAGEFLSLARKTLAGM